MRICRGLFEHLTSANVRPRSLERPRVERERDGWWCARGAGSWCARGAAAAAGRRDAEGRPRTALPARRAAAGGRPEGGMTAAGSRVRRSPGGRAPPGRFVEKEHYSVAVDSVKLSVVV